MDSAVFVFLNGFAGVDKNFDSVIFFFASIGIFIFPFFLLFYVPWRVILFHSIAAASIAFLVNSLIALAWYRARPFEEFDATLLIDSASLFDSFPSDHAAMSAALAASILCTSRNRGILAILLALCISVSRIIAGVHYPSDVLAGIGIGILCSVFVEHFIQRTNRAL